MAFGDRVTRRHVLGACPAEDAAQEFSQENDWDLVGRRPSDTKAGVDYQVVWLTPVNLTFHYTEDLVARESYVYLEGDDFDEVGQYEAQIVEVLRPWTLDQLLQDVAQEHEGVGRSRAILRAGLGAPMEFDPRFFDVIRAAMSNADHRVRSVGVLACSYSPWPQYRPLLDRIAKDDPELETRELAEATLRAFDRHGVV